MQDNTISIDTSAAEFTAAVAELNSGAHVTVLPFARFEYANGRSTYHSDTTHTDGMRDILQLARNTPARKGENRGFKRTSLKFTKDVSVDNASGTGSIVLPLIVDVNFTVPVGTDEATANLLMHRATILLLTPSVVEPLINNREV